jgi:hypothetical protein
LYQRGAGGKDEAKLATTAATSVGRKAEVVRNQKVSHSAQRRRTIGKVGKKKKGLSVIVLSSGSIYYIYIF